MRGVHGMLLQLAPQVSITLPPEVFHRDIASDRLKFIYFRSSKLFVGSHHATSSVDDVITASVGPEVAFDLPNCVMFVIPNRQARQSAIVQFLKTNSTDYRRIARLHRYVVTAVA